MARRVENQLLLHQSYRTSNGNLLDIFKKKNAEKCNERKNSFSVLLLLKNNKQTNNSKNKTITVSISNVGDQLWLGLVLNRSQASADLQLQVYYDTQAKKVKLSDAITNDHFRLNPNCVTENIGISSPG